MIIERKSILSGKYYTRDIDVTQAQLDLVQSGELIQDILPNLTDDDREFLLNGITPEEWEEYMGDEE
jgi:hypothetical protein